MRYSLIREMDVSNGEGIGVSLFVQGCHFHCQGCFNQETWDFDGGKEWTEEVEKQFLELIEKPFIKRVSFLGGEPLAEENVETVLHLIKKIKTNLPDKKIWLFSGYTWESILTIRNGKSLERILALSLSDVFVDGQFQLSNQDINHKKVKWAGSTNQRVIDVKETLNSGGIKILGE